MLISEGGGLNTNNTKCNSLTAEVAGPRKHEDGLIVPHVYHATTTPPLGYLSDVTCGVDEGKRSVWARMNINVDDFQLKRKVCF